MQRHLFSIACALHNHDATIALRWTNSLPSTARSHASRSIAPSCSDFDSIWRASY
jgi:hypothetical protein